MGEKHKKRLLVTASTFPRWEGDTEPRFVLDLAIHMLSLFDVTVLVPAAQGAKDYEIMDGVEVIRYHYFPIHKCETLCYPGAIMPRIKEKKIRVLLVPFLFFSLHIKLIKLLKDYDIVHAHWLIPQGIIQSFFKKAYIVTGHGGDVTSLNKGIVRKLKKRCLKKAMKITAVSEHLKVQMQKIAPDCNPEVISMGVDTRKFGKQYSVKNYFNQNNKKVILFVGRLAEKKGVSYIIEAMKLIDAKLIIVGDGPLREKLEKQAKSQGEKIEFWGAKTHTELKEIYASADIFVAPSVTAKDGDQEGFGLVMLEAMASGLPVVASDSGGISQLITDNVNGLLCEEKNVEHIAEKINLILSDEQLASKIICNAAKSIQQYDYSNIAKEYIRLLV